MKGGVSMNLGVRARREFIAKRRKAGTESGVGKRVWTWHDTGTVFGFTGGFLTVFFGTVFTITGWLARSAAWGAFFQRFATVLFLLTIPLLILGAHCLDLADSKKSKLPSRAEALFSETDARTPPPGAEDEEHE